jgi:hypothetical protein
MASSAFTTTDLFLLDDLEDTVRTGELDERDLEALRSVARWIESFVIKPHEDLGRSGTVCPFVPGSLERKALWLAPERIVGTDVAEVVERMDTYRRVLLDTPPADGDDDAAYNVIVVVFTDSPAGRAKDVFDEVQQQLGARSYEEDGVLFGPYYPGSETPAIHNASFRPFQSPVPFMFVRHGVTGDWEFFLDDDEWLGLWARRYGESGARALGERLRHLPWRNVDHG